MAVTRKFESKVYKYAGSSRRREELRIFAKKNYKRNSYLTRIVKTGRNGDILYTLYVRAK